MVWAPLRVPACALRLQEPTVSLEQTHCPLALRCIQSPRPLGQSREQQEPQGFSPCLPLPSACALRGFEGAGTSQRGPPGQGKGDTAELGLQS